MKLRKKEEFDGLTEYRIEWQCRCDLEEVLRFQLLIVPEMLLAREGRAFIARELRRMRIEMRKMIDEHGN